MKRITIALCAVLGVVAFTCAAFVSATEAGASEVPGLPNCGGNSAGTGNNPQVPWTCGNAKQISGIPGVTVGRLTVKRAPNLTGVVTAVVTLPAPQAFDVPVAIFWHIGKSSGPLTASGSTVIPAGSTTGTVSTGRADVCNGQVDVQVNRPAGFTQKSDLYRLHGPWLEVPTCQDVPGTTVPTTVVGTTTPTSVPPPGQSVPTTSGVPTTPPARVAGCTRNAEGFYVNDVTGEVCYTPSTGGVDATLAYSAMAMAWVGSIAMLIVALSRRTRSS